MQTIDRKELKRLIDSSEDVTVVETLEPDSFKEYHLPGAINVPNDDTFEQSIEEAVPQKDRQVVVYCADTKCGSSADAAKKMETLGYTNVMDYDAGKADWKEAGLPIEAGTAGAKS